MSNTTLRFVSAAVLIAIVTVSVFLGTWASFGVILILGALVLDELHVNFSKRTRKISTYFISQLVYISLMIFTYKFYSINLDNIIISCAIFLNVLLLIYLFTFDISKNVFAKLEKFPAANFVYVLVNFCCLGTLVQNENWMLLLTLLIVFTAGMDTGAWFFGKNFGKHPLWPSVSPKKTREGLFGGMLTAGVFGSVFFALKLGLLEFYHPLIFCILGGVSQLGDLIQSKLKRQANIKDSSALIPGHGGVFDRVDSLIFVYPFFSLVFHVWG